MFLPKSGIKKYQSDAFKEEKEAEEKGLSLSAYLRMLILDCTKQRQ